MLTNTFHHIYRIGLTKERRFWNAGILSWEDLLESGVPSGLIEKPSELITAIKESVKHLEKRNLHYFARQLPSNEWWKLFRVFRDRYAYLDVAATGRDGIVATIALYNGQEIRTYVRGQNLAQFKKDIKNHDVLVTYNGKCFHVPLIESDLGIKLRQVHIDLRYLLKSLGLTGRMKGIERIAGIDRGELAGLEGYHAFFLWEEYRSGEQKSLETLLAYNCRNVVDLEILKVMAYNLKLQDTPFRKTHRLPLPTPPEIPYKADPATVERIRKMPDNPWYDYTPNPYKTDLAMTNRVRKTLVVERN